MATTTEVTKTFFNVLCDNDVRSIINALRDVPVGARLTQIETDEIDGIAGNVYLPRITLTLEYTHKEPS